MKWKTNLFRYGTVVVHTHVTCRRYVPKLPFVFAAELRQVVIANQIAGFVYLTHLT